MNCELHGEIVHLSRLVDDLQELALAEAGRLRLYMTHTNLAEVTKQLIRTLPADDTSPSITLKRDDELPRVQVDVDRFQQVLRNLLENAIRHGKQNGSVEVCVGKSNEGIRLEVSDDGPGIPDEHLERIFDRFHRAATGTCLGWHDRCRQSTGGRCDILVHCTDWSFARIAILGVLWLDETNPTWFARLHSMDGCLGDCRR